MSELPKIEIITGEGIYKNEIKIENTEELQKMLLEHAKLQCVDLKKIKLVFHNGLSNPKELADLTENKL